MSSISLNVWPPLPTVEERVAELTADVDAVTSYRLLNGFYWTPPQATLPAELKAKYATDADVPQMKFGTSLTDQSNMTQTGVDALSNSTNPAWGTAWRGWLDGAAYDLVFDLVAWGMFATAYGNSKKDHLGNGWVQKAALAAAKTASEADNVFAGFGFDPEELEAAKKSFAATL